MKRTLLFVLTLFVVACNGSPSRSDIEKIIEDKRTSHKFDNFSEMSNFVKVNGVKTSESEYVVEITYDVTFYMSLSEYRTMRDNELNELKQTGDKLATEKLYKQINKEIRLIKIHNGSFKKDQTITKKKKIYLLKTENGWNYRMGF